MYYWIRLSCLGTLMILSNLNFAQEKNALYPTRGAYTSFRQFLYNEPAILDSFKIELKERTQKNWEGTYSRQLRYTSSGKKVKRIWGFSDGKDYFIRHQGEYFLLEISEGEYYFTGYDLMDHYGSATAGFLGGAIGGGVYAATAITIAKRKKVKYKLDFSTGETIHQNNSLFLPTSNSESSYKIILYRHGGKKEINSPLSFKLGDTLISNFIPNSYVEITLHNPSYPILLNYGHEFEKSEMISLDENNLRYIECSFQIQEQLPKFTQVETSDGEFESTIPYNKQEKRNNR